MSQDTLQGYISYGCNECDKSFDGVMGLKVHNGKVHGGEDITVECSNCGQEKQVTTWQASNYGHHFCDKDCKKEFQRDTSKLSGNELGRQQEVFVCENCGEVKVTHKDITNNNRWCSRSCQIEALAERAKYRTGSDHWAWRGGVSAYHGVRRNLGRRNWAYIAGEYRQSQDNLCEWCGEESQTNRKLDVHHIIPIRTGGTHHKDNLMALCRSCHSKIESYTRKLFGDVITDEPHTQPLNGSLESGSEK